MPSMKYRLTEKLFRHTLKSVMTGGSREEFLDYVFSMAPRRYFQLPSRRWQKKYDYSEYEEGDLSILKIAPKGQDPEKLLMYFTGDGFYQPPASADIELCGWLARECDLRVWLVACPLISEAEPGDIAGSALKSYGLALEKYSPESISLMGMSCGGLTAMSIGFQIKEKGELPMPGGMILSSVPLSSPPTGEQFERMRELEPLDVTASTEYFQYLASIRNFKDHEYMVRPLKYSMEGFPRTDLFVGTHELAYAFLPDMVKKCSDEGVSLIVHEGEEMMKCWALLGGVPEAEQVKREYAEILG